MPYPINQQLILNNRPGESLVPQGMVIHATATPGATAQNEYNYFNGAYRAASVHYFADWTEVIRTIPENEVAWHAGKSANHLYLSVEMCEPGGTDPEKFAEVWKRTVWLVADACVRYGWSRMNIFSHLDISNQFKETSHTDPIGYLESYGKTWASLIQAIEQEIQNLKNQGEGAGLLENLILVRRGPDERAAGYLADYLNAPVAYIDAISKDNLGQVKTVYVIGGTTKPLERAVLLTGADRYATCQRVLDFIRTGK